MDIVNLTLKNKLQWNFNRNSYIFIQWNTFENFVCKMAAILSRLQCDKRHHHYHRFKLEAANTLISSFVLHGAENVYTVGCWQRPWTEATSVCCGIRSRMHDDVTKWKHFPRYWPIVRGIHRWPVDSPQKAQYRRDLMFSFICTFTNSWANNRDVGD